MTLRERQKTAKANYQRWRTSRYTDLRSAYGRYSRDKQDAWEYCEDLCKKKDGSGLKIISRNSWKFTAGFEYPNPDTGELMFMYISPTYDQEVYITREDLGI